jgi:hypothetical protein
MPKIHPQCFVFQKRGVKNEMPRDREVPKRHSLLKGPFLIEERYLRQHPPIQIFTTVHAHILYTMYTPPSLQAHVTTPSFPHPFQVLFRHPNCSEFCEGTSQTNPVSGASPALANSASILQIWHDGRDALWAFSRAQTSAAAPLPPALSRGPKLLLLLLFLLLWRDTLSRYHWILQYIIHTSLS